MISQSVNPRPNRQTNRNMKEEWWASVKKEKKKKRGWTSSPSYRDAAGPSVRKRMKTEEVVAPRKPSPKARVTDGILAPISTSPRTRWWTIHQLYSFIRQLSSLWVFNNLHMSQNVLVSSNYLQFVARQINSSPGNLWAVKSRTQIGIKMRKRSKEIWWCFPYKNSRPNEWKLIAKVGISLARSISLSRLQCSLVYKIHESVKLCKRAPWWRCPTTRPTDTCFVSTQNARSGQGKNNGNHPTIDHAVKEKRQILIIPLAENIFAGRR